VIGVVETHGRQETAALLGGLEVLPSQVVMHRGVKLSELDLDGALLRRPSLILVDELAHTNVAGARHPKRWQDVVELLDAGVDVFSTMNVQHVESLNDVVAKITGVSVRERVPDSVLEEAHEIKLVDLPPDDLLERLKEGKVYVPAQARRAIESFFRKGNLIALRELALRQTAERVDAQMRAYRSEQGIEQTWAASDQLLVAVSPSPYSAQLVRATRRMAGALHAHWFAVYVEGVARRPLTKADASRLAKNLHLAEQLGAEVITLAGQQAAVEILRFSKQRNITKIIVGKPVVSRFWQRFRPSLVDELVRTSGDIDVYVTAGDAAPEEVEAERAPRAPVPARRYVLAAAAVVVATTVAHGLFGRDQLADVVMLYLLGIMLVATRLGLGPSIFAACASVAAFDFFFIPPFLTFSVGDLGNIVTFFVMFLVAIVISSLTDRIKSQARSAQQREVRTAALYHMSRELAAARSSGDAALVSATELSKTFGARVVVFLAGASGALELVHGAGAAGAERDASIAHWVYAHGQPAGLGTATLPSSEMLFLPLTASSGVLGVLGLTPDPPDRFEAIDEMRLLEAFIGQVALALERARLAEAADRARREVEAEQMRSSLLSSVSHDLRTPLAVITGAASTLLDQRDGIDALTRRELTKTILDEAERLERLIRNLLDMTRIESGAVTVRKEWTPVEEVVGAALTRLEPRLREREVALSLPRDLPLVPLDPVLVEQVLVNLLENAAKYGAGTIEIGARPGAGEVVVEVADRGPGIAPGQEQRIFEKFHRAVGERGPPGVGLGLAICRAIVSAHGGTIAAHNRAGGGASFVFTMPLVGGPSPLPEEPAMDLAEPAC
ncbi:MAG TPA: sensor histidine kinase KdpD, partial [Polyangiaceae bacterium]|nr:sensor histidine kinase KdpD [Polyangiaceae bacterium]